jgi:ankyrin repeat protein
MEVLDINYGPTGTELQAIVKGYELFGVVLNDNIPPKEKHNKIWKLSRNNHVNVNFQYEHFHRNTLLHIAVARGYVDIVKLLIDSKADVNVENAGGNTSLHMAVVHENIDLVKLLIKNKANVNIKI